MKCLAVASRLTALREYEERHSLQVWVSLRKTFAYTYFFGLPSCMSQTKPQCLVSVSTSVSASFLGTLPRFAPKRQTPPSEHPMLPKYLGYPHWSPCSTIGWSSLHEPLYRAVGQTISCRPKTVWPCQCSRLQLASSCPPAAAAGRHDARRDNPLACSAGNCCRTALPFQQIFAQGAVCLPWSCPLGLALEPAGTVAHPSCEGQTYRFLSSVASAASLPHTVVHLCSKIAWLRAFQRPAFAP